MNSDLTADMIEQGNTATQVNIAFRDWLGDDEEKCCAQGMNYEYKGTHYDFKGLVKVLTSTTSELVIEKNIAYGNSVETSKEIMRILYPDGISVEQMDDSLFVVRVIDKLMRIATKKDAFGESPWNDIFGYALLALIGEHKCE